ncbi:MAG: RNA polymerase sigma factor RpoD [Phycisphaerae bacterium]|nr:RNA polymerase sigma factor RpoD [Phycisphaerae bacterium]
MNFNTSSSSSAVESVAALVNPKLPHLKVHARTLERLSDHEHHLLLQLRREPLDYVNSPSFKSRAAEAEIMAPVEMEGGRPIQRFIQAAADPIGDPADLDIPEGAVLSAGQERALFLQYNYCRYRYVRLIHRNGSKPLGVKRLRLIFQWFARVLDLRDQLVNANMPLVLAMAKRTRLSNVDFSELISEGNMALLRAIEKFDVSRGFKFSTYACRAILKAFSRASMKQSRYRQRFPAEFDPDMEKSDFLETKRADLEADCVDQLREIIVRNAADLNEVEQTVIRERFAISEYVEETTPKTLEEVGAIIGVTKERVRQIQNKALTKIKEALENELLVA